MNKISPRTLDLIRRVAGDETANLAAQAEAIPILCDMLEDIVQAARQEGAREALGHGPATLLDEFAMAALGGILADHTVSVKTLDRAAWLASSCYDIARAMMTERAK